MDNVIDMFFKKDASAAENQETGIETFVTPELNDESVESSSSPELPAEAASTIADTTEFPGSKQSESEGEVLESAGGADVEEGEQSTQVGVNASDVVGRVGPSLLVAEDSSDKSEGDVPLSLSKDGQFSLFGDDDFVTPNSEDDKKAGSCGDDKKLTSGKSSTSVKSSSKKASGGTGTTVIPASTPKRKKDQNLEVDDTWTIHYATESFRVTDFVNPFPASGKVKLEELRVEMEKEFYEMTKARTTWDYDEDLKRLYPDVTGTDKGCC